MLKKNVFLRTTKFKAPILQIQAKENINVNSHHKETIQPHIEESLLSNQSSSTRTGSREKILSKNINSTFALSESQTSTSNKGDKQSKTKKNIDANEGIFPKEQKLKCDNHYDLKPKKIRSTDVEDDKRSNEDGFPQSEINHDNGFLNQVKNHEITFQKDSSMKMSFEVQDQEDPKEKILEKNKFQKNLPVQMQTNRGNKTGKFLNLVGNEEQEESKPQRIKSNKSSNDMNYVNEAYKKYGDLNKTSMIKKIMEDNAKLQEEATRSEEIISILIDAWNIQKDKIQFEKPKPSIKNSQENFSIPLHNYQSNPGINFKKNINSFSNLQSLPKSTDNTVSHRFNYKKNITNNETELNNAPLMSSNSNKIIRPRVLKTTTPYKSENKEFIKKFSEKEMNFDDINNFKIIYKFDENDKNKLPSINAKCNSNPGQFTSQINFNNTFNPFNQTIKSKINSENPEILVNDKKPCINPSSQNLLMNLNHNPIPSMTKQMTNVNKINIVSEYYQMEKAGSEKKQEKKFNQSCKKLDPIVLNDGSSNFQAKKINSERECNNLQKMKFPKEIFCSNVSKKYIV